MIFDRLKPWRNQTWNYLLFKKHHTELNDLYWSFAPTVSSVHDQIDNAPPTQSPVITFNYSGEVRRIASDPNTWRKMFSDFENWVRLSALISISGYFEIFFQKAIALALESDPGIQYGKSRLVDGFSYRKYNDKYSFHEAGENCAKGEWNRRISIYKKLFHHIPSSIENHISDLEQIRIMRNGVGHAFGRNMKDYLESVHISSKPMMSLSETDLQKWLGIIDQIALDIDTHLGMNHIGEYETLYFYHNWRTTPQARASTVANFSKHLRSSTNHNGAGREFCRGLITYYDSL
ncbi:MAG TPA: hypothetical protein VGE07_07990 [Herpetosiphonaceae bacterium]